MKLLARARSPYADVPFFASWTQAELARLDRLAEVVDYEPGDILAAGGQRAREFLVLLVGHVDILDGRRRLGTLGVGHTIGEEGLLSDAVSPVAFVATTYVRALVLGPRQFHGLLYEAPSMGRRLALLLAQRLAAAPAPA